MLFPSGELRTELIAQNIKIEIPGLWPNLLKSLAIFMTFGSGIKHRLIDYVFWESIRPNSMLNIHTVSLGI